jgi:hypothetical protein
MLCKWKKFLPNLNVCDVSPRKYVVTLVPKFEDSGSALDNFKGVAGYKQQELIKQINMWRTCFKDVQGTQVFLPNNIIQFLEPSQTLKNCL